MMEGEGDGMVGVVGTITIIVDGSTTLNSRTLNLAVKLDLSGAANDRELVSRNKSDRVETQWDGLSCQLC